MCLSGAREIHRQKHSSRPTQLQGSELATRRVVYSSNIFRSKRGSTLGGPDNQNIVRIECPSSSSTRNPRQSGSLTLECYASELQLRGSMAVVQPHIQNETVFCWNGEESVLGL